MSIQQLLAKIATESGVTDPTRLALIARVSTDYLNLMSQKLAGVDVEGELAIVEASARNLDRAQRKVIGDNMHAWLLQATSNILIKLLIP